MKHFIIYFPLFVWFCFCFFTYVPLQRIHSNALKDRKGPILKIKLFGAISCITLRINKLVVVIRKTCLQMTAYCMIMVARGGADNKGTVIQAGRSPVRFPIVSFGFFIGLILPAALWPWV